MAGEAVVQVRRGCQRTIPESLGDGLSLLAARTSLRRTARDPEIVADVAEHPAETASIVERPGQALGLTEVVEDLVERSERHERAPEVEAEVYGLLEGRAALGQMREGPERLLEMRHGLPVRRLREGPGAGLAAVGE